MNSTQFAVLCVFAGLVTVAFLLQVFALIALTARVKAMFKDVGELSAKVTKHVDRIVPQLEEFIPALKSVTEKVQVMSENVAGISKVAHERALKVDAFVDEATDSARLQMARLQDVISTATLRIDDTVTALQSAIITPVNEVHAIARGIRTGVDVLFGRRRSAVAPTRTTRCSSERERRSGGLPHPSRPVPMQVFALRPADLPGNSAPGFHSPNHGKSLCLQTCGSGRSAGPS